jgi:hypothetical protein
MEDSISERWKIGVGGISVISTGSLRLGCVVDKGLALYLPSVDWNNKGSGKLYCWYILVAPGILLMDCVRDTTLQATGRSALANDAITLFWLSGYRELRKKESYKLEYKL